MTIEELNEFILHYIEKDKTQSAIMLSAPWGTGKSYYINNSLIPFLEQNESRKSYVKLRLFKNFEHEIDRNLLNTISDYNIEEFVAEKELISLYMSMYLKA